MKVPTLPASPLPGGRARRAVAGFTLVEVLVALFAMTLLAGLAWQGLDGVLRARDAGREMTERAARLATVLAQWEQDLQGLYDSGVAPAIAFDGRTLRLTRRVDGGVAVVAWSLHGKRWQRWLGPPTVRAGELQETWLRSLQMQGTEPGHLAVAEGVSEWQVYFHRGSDWSNAQSTGDLLPVQPPASSASGAMAQPVQREALPNAVRLVITLGEGKLTRDIMLGPQGG